MGGAGAPASRPAGVQLEWDKPAAWTEQPPSQMRLGSYAFVAADGGKADVSISTLVDAGGGLLANINRWRGQVGLAPVAEADLSTTAQQTRIAGQVGWLVDIAGTPAGGSGVTRIIGAIVPVSGTSWFFKMIGPDAVVASQREAFNQLIASIRAVTPAPGAAPTPGAPLASEQRMPADDVHAGLNAAPSASASTSMPGGAAAVPPPAAPTGFSFKAPDGWQEQPSTPFRVVNFIVPGNGVPAAEFYVTPLTGAAGGELANVNRWRAQLKLPAIAEAELATLATSVTGPAGTFKIFDLSSTGPGLKTGERARMLAAILVRGDTSWFFRLTGEINHVDSLRGAYTAFLQSCQFEAAP
jgi:hypothetical protein